MIKWASSDVDKLLRLAEKQDIAISKRSLAAADAKTLSMRNTTFARDMKLERGLRCSIPIGRFIGKGGSNLRSLQKRTGTLIYQEFQPSGYTTKWLVYYNEDLELTNVKLAMLST
jgi:hypothetical protein